MSHYWIFGSSKALGMGVAKILSRRHSVTCFSRSASPSAPDAISVDFADLAATQSAIELAFERSVPDGVVFCQRYRPKDGLSDLEAVKAGLDVELGPILYLVEAATAVSRRNPAVRPLSIVLISSVAGLAAHVDVPLYYHLLKAVTVTATRTLAAQGATNGLRVNCIVLGEFMKYPAEDYTEAEKKKFRTIENFAVARRICLISDVADAAEFLLSDRARYVTGQLISRDGGLSCIAT